MLPNVLKNWYVNFIYCYRLSKIFQFKERFLELNGHSDSQQSSQTKVAKKGIQVLLHELSDDKEDMDNNDDMLDNADWPWLHYFNQYINIVEQVPEGWSILKWWGTFLLFHFLIVKLHTDACIVLYRLILRVIILHGLLLHVTTSLSCPLQFRASAHFRKVA